MNKESEYSIELSSKIEILSQKCYTYEKIAKPLRIPKPSVTYTLFRFKETRTHSTRNDVDGLNVHQIWKTNIFWS